jgi:hypothetical protein
MDGSFLLALKVQAFRIGITRTRFGILATGGLLGGTKKKVPLTKRVRTKNTKYSKKQTPLSYLGYVSCSFSVCWLLVTWSLVNALLCGPSLAALLPPGEISETGWGDKLGKAYNGKSTNHQAAPTGPNSLNSLNTPKS